MNSTLFSNQIMKTFSFHRIVSWLPILLLVHQGSSSSSTSERQTCPWKLMGEEVPYAHTAKQALSIVLSANGRTMAMRMNAPEVFTYTQSKDSDSIRGEVWIPQTNLLHNVTSTTRMDHSHILDMSDDGHTIVYSNANNKLRVSQLDGGLLWEKVGTQFDVLYAVAMSGDAKRIVMGWYNEASILDKKIQVYQRSGSKSYIPLGPVLRRAASTERFEHQMSFSKDGNTIATRVYNSIDSTKEYIRVFRWDASLSVWSPLGSDVSYLGQPATNGARYQFGIRLKLSRDGNTLVVATKDGVNQYNNGNGRVDVYSYDPITKNWRALGQPLYSIDRYAHIAIATLSGNGLVLAVSEEYAGGLPGIIRVYRWVSDSSTWVMVGETFENGKDGYGTALDLSDDGSVVAMGTRGSDHVYVFGTSCDSVPKCCFIFCFFQWLSDLFSTVAAVIFGL